MSFLRARQHAITGLFPHNANRRFIIPNRADISQVPDVVDTAEVAAEGALVAAGYTLGTQGAANHPTIIIGNIISTDPIAGTYLTAGSPVDYVVSLGP